MLTSKLLSAPIRAFLALFLPVSLVHAGLRDDLPASEYDALIAFFQAAGGESWENNTDWLDPDADDWFGVTTSSTESGRTVTEINLRLNGLTGFIPPEIGDLPSLIELILQQNELGGSIPSEIGNLPQLVRLDLGTNRLSGSIPSEISNLSSLQSLGLTNNLLTGAIPPELGDLPSLLSIALSINSLSGTIPPELGNLASLTFLSLIHI